MFEAYISVHFSSPVCTGLGRKARQNWRLRSGFSNDNNIKKRKEKKKRHAPVKDQLPSFELWDCVMSVELIFISNIYILFNNASGINFTCMGLVLRG